MKSKIILFLTFALLYGCSDKKASNAGDALCMQLTSTDYEIISLALDNFFSQPRDSLGKIDSNINKRDYYKLLITIDSTIEDPNSNDGYASKMYNLIDSTGKPLLRQKCKIDCSRIRSFNVHSMTEQERKETYGLGYTKFYKMFPDAYGSIFIARPYYFENKERSVIYIEFYKQVLWAEAAYILFKFENGKWIYIRTEEVWVS